MTVLVLARDFDPTVDAVVLTLAERQVPVFRTDLRDFPTWLGLDAELRDGRWSGRLWTREREVRLEDVRSVWYRNPSSYRFMVTLSADERAFAHREATLGLGGMLASLDALWANHPNRCADAVYKPYQWKIASQCGLSVANTAITNDPDSALRFIDQREVIVKALGPSGVTRDGESKVAYTRRLTKDDVDGIGCVISTATTLQQWVPKAYEVRLTVIGEEWFPIAIRASTEAARRAGEGIRMITVDDWPARAAALRDELVGGGKLTSPAWQQALLAVPRHALVPEYFRKGPSGWELLSAWSPQTQQEWWRGVWANTSLVIQLGEVGRAGQQAVTGPASSSSAPSLMTRMLEALQIRDGHRVLEIGTGTGYNAALMSHRLGEENVYSVDVDTELVDLARQRLAALGYQPTLAAVDGVAGLPEHAPYDRIIATCAVSRVPWTWARADQTGRDHPG